MSLQLSRTTLGVFVGLCILAPVAWVLGRAQAFGAGMGYLLGASLGILGALWQLHWARVDSKRVLRAQSEVFLVKLAAVLAFGLCFRYLPQLAEWADWRAFIVGFAAAVLVALPLGAWDTACALRERKAH